MKLKVIRYSSQADSTSGLLFEESELGLRFLCYTLEDEFRTEGGFHQRYTKKYPDIHRGMLHVTDVPGFEYILIHTGNTDEHTAGCLIVGDTQSNNGIIKDGFVGQSVNAYKRIYPSIAGLLEKGNTVTIQYITIDNNVNI